MKQIEKKKKLLNNWNEINNLFRSKLNVTKVVNRINKENGLNESSANYKFKCYSSVLKIMDSCGCGTSNTEEVTQIYNGINELDDFHTSILLYFVYSSFTTIENQRIVILLSDKNPIKQLNEIELTLSEFISKSQQIILKLNYQIDNINKVIINQQPTTTTTTAATTTATTTTATKTTTTTTTTVPVTKSSKIKSLLSWSSTCDLKGNLEKVKLILDNNRKYWELINIRCITLKKETFTSTKQDLTNMKSIMEFGFQLLALINLNYYHVNIILKKRKQTIDQKVQAYALYEKKDFKRIVLHSFELLEYLQNEEKINDQINKIK